MTRQARRHWIVIGFAIVAVRLVASGQQQATFRAATDAVRVDVSVRNAVKAVTGLAAADFDLRDNGVPQAVTDVSFAALPIDVTVALDVSLSVGGRPLSDLSAAIRQLARDLKTGDRLKLLTFNMRVHRVMDFTSDLTAIDRALATAAAGGGTSVWDALGVAMVSASDPDRRQLLVVFTDAIDGASATTPDVLLAVAERTTAAVAAVVPATAKAARPGTIGFERLRVINTLAHDTGGAVVEAQDDIGETFRRVLDEFRSSYVLHFTPHGVDRRGFHTLDVAIKRRGTFTIRARRGYFVD